MISVPERVKDALRDGRLLKNYIFNVLKNDGTVDFAIENDTLVYESVKFDERMCSGDTLKFGLCEGSSLEFQYFDHPNITGRQLQCFIEVQYIDADGDPDWHTIPMGFFTVKKCSRQASTGIQKVTAYNKLQSEYLDAKANQMLIDEINAQPSGLFDEKSISVFKALEILLDTYQIRTFNGEKTVPVMDDFVGLSVDLHQVITTRYGGNYYRVFNITVHFVVPASPNNIIFIYELEQLQNKVHTVLDGKKDGMNNPLYNNHNYDIRGSSWCVADNERYKALDGLLYPDETHYESDVFNNVTSFTMTFPIACEYSETNAARTVSSTEWQDFKALATSWIEDIEQTENLITFWEVDASPFEVMRLTADDIKTDITLRDLQAAVYETQCQYGQLSRVTDLFEGVELNHLALYPADTLYPANNLYPGGVSETSFRSWYSKLWTDTVGEQSFRNLIITYKGLDGNNVPTDFVYETVVDPDGTTDYIMDDNWLFRNLIWTQADIESYAAAMVTKMQSIHWFPFEMWAAGLPYVETGDMIEIMADDETHTSYVLQRQLSGIQNLQDTYINGTLDIF